jgi:hypothetical protein
MTDTLDYAIKEIKSNQETIARPFLNKKNGELPTFNDVSGLFVPPMIQDDISNLQLYSYIPNITSTINRFPLQTSTPPKPKPPPLLPSPYDQNPQIVNGNFVPEKASLVKQISCPTVADVNYDNSSLPFITEQLIPESLGYIVGYGFTGRGQNDSSSTLDKMGFTGSYGNRVLGYNYFLDSDTCNSFTSSTECKGEPNSLYIRGAPTMDPKGMLTGGLVQDVMDLNPLEMAKALWGTGNFSTSCQKRSLPVGSSIDNAKKQYSSRLDYLKAAQTCLDKCNTIVENTSTAKSNCIKKCSEGWWLENKCTSNKDKFTYGSKEYFDSIEIPESQQSSMTYVNFIPILLLCFIVILCIIILFWNYLKV